MEEARVLGPDVRRRKRVRHLEKKLTKHIHPLHIFLGCVQAPEFEKDIIHYGGRRRIPTGGREAAPHTSGMRSGHV